MKKRRFALSTTHIILFSFLIVILIGAILLSLPVSSASGEATPFLDALFTATTSTCVTGLVVPYDLNVGAFNIVPEVPEIVLISFN